MSTQMRDGSEAGNVRLGRLVQFDERSRNFSIRPMVEDKPLRSYTWRVGAHLDQGQEGACVGYAFAHELCARPMVTPVDGRFARNEIYWNAQRIDPWPGGSYPGAQPQYEGTSVLAGAQMCKKLGHFEEYRWAFDTRDLLLALGYAGPVVLGLNWHRGMFQPDAQGRIRPTGPVEGGHAILAYRVAVQTRRRAEPQVWLWNSWGPDWGLDGTCWMTFDDLGVLLKAQGEACVPLKRRRSAS